MSDSTALGQLSALAARQLGLFSRQDAATVGLTGHQLRRLVRIGLVERVAPRIFRFSASARTWNQLVLAACLDGGPMCVASHRTAAALHGFDGFGPGIVEVLVPMSVRHRRRSVIVHHTRDLPPADICRVGPIPATTPERTLLMLGAVVTADMVEEAFDGLERDAKVRRNHVDDRYAALRAPGRNGIGAMTDIRSRRVARERVPWSVLERRMRRQLEQAGHAIPESRYWVRTSSGRAWELDFAYVAERLGIEVDGHGAHATRRQRARDNVRANDLANEGWSIRRFTYEQVRDEPLLVVKTVRAALASHRL
ncbi:MAG: type IV toxin-antitoxin system AbiEi family antitoxin domain-containing protein [Acidimicrobiia bacterium]